MAETPLSKFRLRPATLNAIDVLATSAGSRSEAVREAVHHWRAAVTDAAGRNAAELAGDEWALLAAACDPRVQAEECADIGEAPDWSEVLARRLNALHSDRHVLLPSHRAEREAAGSLAQQVGAWGPVRGYALMAAIRWLWHHPRTEVAEWWRSEVWLVARQLPPVEGRAADAEPGSVLSRGGS